MIVLGRPAASLPRYRLLADPPSEEAIRRRIVLLCFVVYWLLIFEGALRKWAFPQVSSILFFIRDPFLLLAYWYALRSSRLEGKPWLVVIAVLGVGFAYLACLQVLVDGVPVLTVGYGWRNYFLYAPLALVIYTHFRRADVDRLVRDTLLVAIPLAGLVVVQFFSPPDAWINKGLSEEGGAFLVIEDVVRTYGTFTFTSGQATYAACLLGMLAVPLLRRKGERLMPIWLVVGSALAVAVTVMLSGSRTVFMLTGLTVLLLAIGGAIAGRRDLVVRAILVPTVATVIAGVLYPIVFPRSFEAMGERQRQAVEAEGRTELRALDNLIGFVAYLPETPLLGHGLGFGTAGGAALATGYRSFTLEENELSRIVQEVGPIGGLAYLGLRFALCLWILWAAMQAVRARGDGTALALATVPLWLLSTAPVTFQGTLNGYAWFTAGLCLAAARAHLPSGLGSGSGVRPAAPGWAGARRASVT